MKRNYSTTLKEISDFQDRLEDAIDRLAICQRLVDDPPASSDVSREQLIEQRDEALRALLKFA